MRVLTRSALLGVVAGARSMLAITFAARTARRPTAVRRALLTLTVLEVVADKLPFLPSRTEPVSLLGRAGSGALASALVAPPRRRAPAAVVGASVAVVAAFALVHLRARVRSSTGAPDAVVALVEDGIALALGAACTHDDVRA